MFLLLKIQRKIKDLLQKKSKGTLKYLCLARGKKFVQAGLLEEAVANYELAIALAPNLAEAYLELGNLLSQQGKWEDAIQNYHKAIALKPTWAEAYFYRGNALQVQTRYDEAIQDYKKAKILKLEWPELDENSLRARKSLENNQIVQESCESIIQYPGKEHFNIGNLCLQQEQPDKAYESYQKAVVLQADLEQAIVAEYQEAIAKKPQCNQLKLSLGQFYLSRGKLAEAESNFQQALDAELSLLERVATLYHHAISENPNSTELYLSLGNLCLNQGCLEQAIENYNRAIQIQPNCVEAYSQLAFVLRKQEDLKKAISIYQQALELEPNCVELYFQLGNTLIARCEKDEALKYYYQGNQIKFRQDRDRGILGRICFASLAKSGTIYIANALQTLVDSCSAASPQTLIYPLGPLPFPHHFWRATTIEPWNDIRSILVYDHVPANSYNRFIISLLFDRLIVNVRDPRQALLSFVHHLNREKGIYYCQYSNFIDLFKLMQFPKSYFDLPLTEQITWQLENWFFPAAIQWIDGWLNALEDPSFNPKILLTKYETLVVNPKEFFKKILDFLEIEESKFTMPEKPKFQKESHYRQGQIDEWRKVFTPEHIEKVNSMIPDRFFDKFGWQK
jgi:tetratricopeptide (TPR) repeat protein